MCKLYLLDLLVLVHLVKPNLLGMVFWLLGAYASFYLKCIFDILKNLKEKINMYIFTCYVLRKSFHEKSTFYVACVKNIKLGGENKAFHKIDFLFFT
jgi:hypothetical protein